MNKYTDGAQNGAQHSVMAQPTLQLLAPCDSVFRARALQLTYSTAVCTVTSAEMGQLSRLQFLAHSRHLCNLLRM